MCNCTDNCDFTLFLGGLKLTNGNPCVKIWRLSKDFWRECR